MSQSSNAHATKDKPLFGKLVIGLIRLLSHFSLKNQQRVGSALGRFLSWFPNYNRNVVRANLKQAYPDLTDAERKQLELKVLQENAKGFAELGAVWEWPIERLLPYIHEVHGYELLDQAFSKHKGVIMLSPHFGCWEAVAVYLSNTYDFTFLYQPQSLPTIENYIVKARSRVDTSTPAPTNIKGVRLMFQRLKENKMVGILPDQDPGESGGIHAPFFGYPARTMTLVSKLAAKAQCDVLFIVAERLPNGEGFDLHIFPADSEVASTDELTAATALNRGVEKVAAINPAQYLWTYKRFRHPPKNVKDLY
jgi:KDO2-lipid IV(A) lauroyltransferase